jgi:selenocysteine-specific elongation factor
VSYRLDVALEELESIPDGARVHVHHGTAAVLARVARAGERYAQLRLAEPVVAARDDRVVLRQRTTVGGGVVLDPAPPRRLDPERLVLAEQGRAEVYEPVLAAALEARGLAAVDHEWADGWVFSREWLEAARDELRRRIGEADPLDPGVAAPAEPWGAAIVPLLGLERRGAKLYFTGSTAALGEREAAAADLERALAEAGFEPVRVEDATLARYLEEEGRLVRVGDGYAVGRDAYERARVALIEECGRSGSITLARLRDLLRTSRRPAQLLLKRFDADGVTRRVGDLRVLRRAGRSTTPRAAK